VSVLLSKNNGQYSDLYKILGYQFKNVEFLREALTHPSLEGSASYQRLEFVGDRVLGLVIANWMFELYPDVGEGGLASRHSNLVRREACAKVAEDLNLGKFIHMAKSSEDSGGRTRETIIADACESVIGAIFMDAGYEEAEKFVRKFWHDLTMNGEISHRDAKTRLQEKVQAKGKPTPTYVTVNRSGPDHEPIFTISVKVQDNGEEIASGRSKREAEQIAAGLMISRFENEKIK
jgi:ribonuclease III